MHRYSAFGGILACDLPIEELAPAEGTDPADWTLQVTGDPPGPLGTPLGSDTVYGTVRVSGFRGEDRWSLVFDDTGRFDISSDGRRITWFRPDEVSLRSAMADVTSRVLAMALHAAGVFSMHASAVSVDGVGLAFLAPKFHGKSTLCSALVLTGGRAISDDTVPVESGRPPLLRPGVPRLRLWNDVANRMFGIGEGGEVARKHLVGELAAGQVETRPVPFEAAYVLNPVSSLADGAPVARERMDDVSATVAVMSHAKLGAILSGAESADLMARAAVVATTVPVYSLMVVRDLARIDDVAATIRGWHAAG